MKFGKLTLYSQLVKQAVQRHFSNLINNCVVADTNIKCGVIFSILRQYQAILNHTGKRNLNSP